MDIISIILIVLGLSVFELISSIDNAVINAEVLSTMSQKAKKWFMTWGLIFAVVVVRGILPMIIVFLSNPSLGIIGAVGATFSNDPHVHESIEKSAPVLLVAGGTFLILLFLHWLFIEEKHYGIKGEMFIHKNGIWFYAISSIFITAVVAFAANINPSMAIGTVVGSTFFFITDGFKKNAEEQEKKLLTVNGISDLSKIFYLEILDATFSIDGVLGAFAFTLSVPLILIGNGLGALAVRQLTLSNIERVKKYVYLKNGAMYSVLFLGSIMIADSFGVNIPQWFSPLVTISVIAYFLWKSKQWIQKDENIS